MTKSVKRAAIVLWLALCLAASCICTLIAAADSEEPAQPAAINYTTAADMAADKANLLGQSNVPNSSGTITVENGKIIPNGGYILYYNNSNVQAIDLDIQITDTSAVDISFALRVTNTKDGKASDEISGYWAYIQKKGSGAAIHVQLCASDGTVTPLSNVVSTHGTAWTPASLFDGKIHNVKFSAVDKGDETTDITLMFDNNASATVTANTATLPTENTGVYIRNQNTPPAKFNIYIEPPVESVSYTTSGAMAENAEKILKDYAGEAVTLTADGNIPSSNGKLAYNAEVQGIDSYIRFTKATQKHMLFHLRTQGGNAPWNTGHVSYTAYVDGKSVTLYRADTGDNGWNSASKIIATKKDFTSDIFDGDAYRIKFYATENSRGHCEVAFTIGDETVSGVDTETPLAVSNTKFFVQPVTPGAAEFELLPNYTPPTTAQYVDADGMIFSKLLYSGTSANATQLKSVLDAVDVPNGTLVYKKAIDAADLDIKVTEGESLQFALRASSDDLSSTTGYLLKAEKNENGTAFTLYKRATADGQLETLKTGVSTVNLFDGNKHNIRFKAFGKQSVAISAELDSAVVIEDVADGTAPVVQGNTVFVITHSADSALAFKIYGENGTDITIPQKPYSVYTTKSLFKSSALWDKGGTAFKDGELTSVATEPRAMYRRSFENVMYKFDARIDLDGAWFAVYLNANNMNMPWQQGLRTVMMFVQGTQVSIQYNLDTVFASFDIGDVALNALNNFECGIYKLTADNGKEYAFVRVAINDKEYYNEPLPEGTYSAPGMLAFVGYGSCSYTVYPTTDEADKIPSGTDGQEETRGDESGMNNNVKVTDFAPITNSFAPAYSYIENEMILRGNGDVSYKAAVDFTKFAFSFKLDTDADEKGQYLEFFFNRKRQDQFRGAQLALDASNYAYGVRLLPNGSVELMKTTAGSAFTKPMTFEAGMDMGVDFADGNYHTVTVYRELLAGGGLKITLFVDDFEVGYSYTDTDYYADNYPMQGYISFCHSTANAYASIRDIVFEGTEISPAQPFKAQPCNFVTYYPDTTEQTGGRIYFVPQGANSATKWTETYGLDGNGNYTVLLGRAFFPEREITLPKTYTGNSVRVVSVGFTDEASRYITIALKDTEADYTVPQDEVERIAIRESEDGAYFIYAESGKEYLPVGGNYMGLRGGDHSTFDAATSFTEADYDPIKTDAMMREFAAAGGNMIRVFLIGRTDINPGISGDKSYAIDDEQYYYEGLYVPYMENVAHFLSKAKQYGVYVMLTLGDADVPSNSYYLELQGGQPLSRNEMYLTQNGVNARAAYARNVVKYFTEKHAELVPAIFSIAFQNEFAMYGNETPFDDKSAASFTAANGVTYDMTDGDDRQKCFEDGVIYYLNALTAAVKGIDPDMLVNEGSFTLNIVGNGDEVGCPARPENGDPRYPARFDVYLSSDIDFLDVHIYFRNRDNNTIRSSFAKDLTDMNFYGEETQQLLKKKPLFMGEFGAATSWAANWDEPNGALPSAHDVFIETVRLAREAGFKGFAVWTMESHLQNTWWNLLSYDGTFATFKEMIAEMHGVELITGVSAQDVSGKAGENNSITVTGVAEGDKVYYRTQEFGEWTLENPVFTEEGVYTVYYKVTREFAPEFTGSATVTVAAAQEPKTAGCNCGSNVVTGGMLSAAVAVFAAAFALAARRKKKQN